MMEALGYLEYMTNHAKRNHFGPILAPIVVLLVAVEPSSMMECVWICTPQPNTQR